MALVERRDRTEHLSPHRFNTGSDSLDIVNSISGSDSLRGGPWPASAGLPSTAVKPPRVPLVNTAWLPISPPCRERMHLRSRRSEQRHWSECVNTIRDGDAATQSATSERPIAVNDLPSFADCQGASG